MFYKTSTSLMHLPLVLLSLVRLDLLLVLLLLVLLPFIHLLLVLLPRSSLLITTQKTSKLHCQPLVRTTQRNPRTKKLQMRSWLESLLKRIFLKITTPTTSKRLIKM
ncbi:uncharacterized protein LOC110224588 [Arabidopsis lyrata subsp. lyrata]|uniref:uncharacterized protein LOC110224588 n=1 Tax=Arabidopsis lyrata subsp. lyrata TaxID=81972 RepID=UPI000A29A6D6|nr:uncharacterized protein LOC110224588 [Arabidopsis lyrata subsp. lyrata]|eukprot:XP_020866535.1 uncharacterized protein LOC110224588 [Arabidopsis lyrata subsp. lyrata]